MKVVRWYGILYVSFLLWLLLFPPWMESDKAEVYDDLGWHVSTVSHGLGHHWRFSVPFHWEYWYGPQGSFFLPNLGARIDYRLMLYEAVIGLVAIGLLSLLLPALVMPVRKMIARAKVEFFLVKTHIRNWRFRNHNRTITGFTCN